MARFISISLLLTFALSLSLCSGREPLYADIRMEMDSFSTRMKQAFDRFTSVLKEFDSKLATITASFTTELQTVNGSIANLGAHLRQQFIKYEATTEDLENITHAELSVLKDDMLTMQKDSSQVRTQLDHGRDTSKEILSKVEGLRKDFRSFQKKMISTVRTQINMTALMNAMENNKHYISNKIAELSQNIVCSKTEDLQPLQASMDQLQNNMSSVAESMRNIGRQKGCTAGWARFHNSCYLLVNDVTSWKLAKFTCRQLDSFLLEMFTESEVEFVSSLVANKTSEVWTGGTIGKKGVWYWTGSKSEVNFDLFKSKYPNGRERQYCATYKPGTLSLDDRNCGKQHPFVCRMFNFQQS